MPKRTDIAAPSRRLLIHGQDIFTSVINLVWINFANDLRNFDEKVFIHMFDEHKRAGGNSFQW
jgi:hypothetical protein